MISNWLELLNKDLIQEALTHSSLSKDDKDKKNNERLEFFGDAVLKLIFSKYLLSRFVDADEGLLTKYRSRLISDELLSTIALEIGIEKHIKTGSSVAQHQISKSILGNTIEALIGAIYNARGYELAENFVLELWDKHIDQALEDALILDYKSLLQERVQALYKTAPEYRLLRSSGPDHAKEFEIGVFVDDKLLGQAKGLTKKIAGQNAAKAALENKFNI
jgi:ribonuclease III